MRKIGIYLIGIVLGMILISMFLSSIMGLFSSGVSMVVSTSYQSDDIEITNSNSYYQYFEVALLYAIENVEDDYSDYDEYSYSIDGIGHDPYQIAAYLTAKYGEFTTTEVKSELEIIFNEQYNYELTEVIEERTRTRTRTTTDPITGEETTEEEEDDYDWYVLEVVLTTNGLEEILLDRLDDEEKELYEVLMDTKGNFISFLSPINQEWYSATTSDFGYRLDPFTDEIAFHTGVDIAESEGTDLIAVFDGSVLYTGYDSDGYGKYVIIEQEETGITALYGHCYSIDVSENDAVSQGDVVATVGSTGRSTGNHVHFEIRDSDGNKLNPYFYLSSETVTN